MSAPTEPTVSCSLRSPKHHAVRYAAWVMVATTTMILVVALAIGLYEIRGAMGDVAQFEGKSVVGYLGWGVQAFWAVVKEAAQGCATVWQTCLHLVGSVPGLSPFWSDAVVVWAGTMAMVWAWCMLESVKELRWAQWSKATAAVGYAAALVGTSAMGTTVPAVGVRTTAQSLAFGLAQPYNILLLLPWVVGAVAMLAWGLSKGLAVLDQGCNRIETWGEATTTTDTAPTVPSTQQHE